MKECAEEAEIIENIARTLELPLLIRSVVSSGAEREFSVFSPPNLMGGILGIQAHS